MLVFVTAAGVVHGWDLRARREAWCCIIPPDLGYPTAIELGPDHCWFVLGTHRGYLCVWDIRFQIMVKCYLHSSGCPVHALKYCPPREKWMQAGRSPWEVPTVYVASGDNEVRAQSCLPSPPFPMRLQPVPMLSCVVFLFVSFIYRSPRGTWKLGSYGNASAPSLPVRQGGRHARTSLSSRYHRCADPRQRRQRSTDPASCMRHSRTHT